MNIYRSGWYDREHEARMKFIRNFISNELSFHKSDSKLLDMGCFRCSLVDLLKDYDISYEGIDVKKYTDREIRLQDLNDDRKLHYPRNHFDIIVASGILEHLFYPDEIMKEMKRILKNDGTAVISLPNDKNILARFSLLAGREPPSIEEQVMKHHWSFTPEIARQWVSQYFKIVDFDAYIGIWGRKYLSHYTVNLLPNLLCSEYFLKVRK